MPADLLILAAMPVEAAPLEARLTDARSLPSPFVGASRPVTAVAGRLGETEARVVTCGIGVAAASAVVTWAILAERPRAVVSAGSAGGLAADIEVGALVVGEEFRYFLADATAFGYAPGQVPGQPESFTADPVLVDAAEAAARTEGGAVRRGPMLSGDAFVTAPLADPMRERFPGALSADMETTAIAQTCATLGVPFVALRAISDLCGPAAGQQFHLELDLVAETSAAAVARLAGRI